MLDHAHRAPPAAATDGACPTTEPPTARPTPSALAAGLYVVATPIGCLQDLSSHAHAVLRDVDVIAAEDTRVTRVLLDHLGLRTPLIACHDHNEARRAPEVVARIQAGERVALTSDAGTPGISDPGARVVAAVHAAGLPVRTVPGPSAVIALLSVAGFNEPRFRFEGFLPAQAAARRARLGTLTQADSVVVLYEAPHRITDTIADLAALLEPTRTVVLGRELTKRFEQVHRAPIASLPEWLHADPDRQRGEFVLAIDAAPAAPASPPDDSLDPWLRALCTVLPPRQAARIAAQATGLRANTLYQRALDLRGGGMSDPGRTGRQAHRATDKSQTG